MLKQRMKKKKNKKFLNNKKSKLKIKYIKTKNTSKKEKSNNKLGSNNKKKKSVEIKYNTNLKKSKLPSSNIEEVSKCPIIIEKDNKIIPTATVNKDVKEPQTRVEEEVTDDNQVGKRRRGRNKKEKIYFSKKTEDAIVEYNNENCYDKKNFIYEEKIKFSFEKLVENIFNTFKFTYFDNSPTEIQKETVSHLVSNIHKFQSGKGKAFSYFSIIAKNYLIFHNNNNYKRFNQHVDISETPSEDSVCLQTEDLYHKNIQSEEYMKLLIEYWESNVNKIFSKQRDLNIAYAVIELFRNCHKIENFNKKHLYLYIRELSNSKTQQITKVINKMKPHYAELEENYYNDGII